MSLSFLFNLFLPHLAGLRINGAHRSGRTVRITATPVSDMATCTSCATPSVRVHSRYERRLSDTPVCGQEMLIHLQVRRFFCDHTACEQKIFAEQLPGLTQRHARRTPHLSDLLTHLAMTLGGRAGTRLTAHLAAAVSRMSLLRLIRARPDTEPAVPRILGVDDFALRKGHVYGTLLVDVQTRRPVDLLEERTADALQAWLRDRPGVEVICRDRAGAYAEGARRGAPDALQVADRWHMWHNLGQAVEKVVARHRTRFRRPNSTGDEQENEPDLDRTQEPPTGRVGWMAERTRTRHAQVHHLRQQGKTVREIAGELGLARNTVRRFVRADDPEELLGRDGTGKRPKAIVPFEGYLRRRFTEGCTNASVLWTELQQQGYGGSYASVRDAVRPWRCQHPLPGPPSRPPTARQVTAWIMTHPDHLDQDQRTGLKQVLADCPELELLSGLVQDFARIMSGREGHQVDAWMQRASQTPIPELGSFAVGLGRDRDAVIAGLSLPYSSGVVEGHVNRLKMLKRQMYGRAKPDLLRKRVLSA